MVAAASRCCRCQNEPCEKQSPCRLLPPIAGDTNHTSISIHLRFISPSGHTSRKFPFKDLAIGDGNCHWNADVSKLHRLRTLHDLLKLSAVLSEVLASRLSTSSRIGCRRSIFLGELPGISRSVLTALGRPDTFPEVVLNCQFIWPF